MIYEIWKDIQGYEETYSVSNFGNVIRKSKNKIIKVKTEKNGYRRVHLSQNGVSKSILLHRIVALAFVENPSNFKTVNHKDEDKSNNRADNLEWCDMSYQNSYGVGAKNRNKAKWRKVAQLDMGGNLIKIWDSAKSIAEELNLQATSIMCVCKGTRRYKSTGGYKFKYAEELQSD